MTTRIRTENLLRDELTGVYSRASLYERLREEIERASRYSSHFSLLMLDVDHFKSVNDAFGHTQGDRVLNEFARRLRNTTRSTDLVFRYGGDEFIVLFPHTEKTQAAKLAQTLLEGIANTPFSSQPPLTLTVSIGVATFPIDGETPETLFDVIDQRHYRAKRAGRNCVVSENMLLADEKADSIPEEPPRLIERDQQQQTLYTFLDDLPEYKRGVLAINGPAGSGKTRFLAEARKIARLRGYVVLSLKGSPALKNRRYGALDIGRREWLELPSPVSGQAVFTAALLQLLHAKNHAGILLAVDHPAEIDMATLDMIHALFTSPGLPYLGLVYTNGENHALPVNLDLLSAATPEAPLRESVNLEPISLAGMRVWVRHALHWEASQEFLDWLYGETAGLPILIQAGLEYVVSEGIVRHGPHGQECRPDFANLPLARELAHHAATPHHNLPTEPSGFVGREEEIHHTKHLFQNHRLVTISGPDGLGKTHLAIQIAHESLDVFSDGVYFVHVDAHKQSGKRFINQLTEQIGEVVHFSSLDQTDASRLLDFLSQKRLLLILDGMDTPDESVTTWLNKLLAQTEHLILLVTARQRLGLPGEGILDLRGLLFPKADQFDDLEEYSAIQLFVSIARSLRPDFRLNESNQHDVARICSQLEGMPLGIELAASWVQAFSCQEIADRIENNLASLVSRAQSKQYGGLLAVFDSFWQLLSEHEQDVLDKLIQLKGEFTADVARRQAGASIFFLDALASRAFLHRTWQGGYAMHELLRQYVVMHNHHDGKDESGGGEDELSQK
jgi:diguanylate cyclase (GGDEF)-like protein